MKDQSQCAMTTSISQIRVRLNETKFSPANQTVQLIYKSAIVPSEPMKIQ